MNDQWTVIAIIFFGILAYIAWVRWRDQHWIEKTYGRENVLAMSFGVNYFGKASEPGKPRRSSGFLLLLKDKLVFKSRFSSTAVEIPAPLIKNIYPDNTHKGINLHQSIMKVDFLDPENKRESVAFRVPYPPQWIQAIENISPNLIEKTED